MSGPAESIDCSSSRGYSAEVRLWLRLNGEVLPLAQIGPDRVILREAVPVPRRGLGELVMTVDGRERRWPVEVGEAIPGSRLVPVRLVAE